MNQAKIMMMKQNIMKLSSLRQYQDAKKLALKLVKKTPKDLEAWYVLSQLQEQLGEKEDAVHSLIKASQAKSPVYQAALTKAVNICFAEGLCSLGIKPAQKLIKLVPDSAEFQFKLGYFWFRSKHFHKALDFLLKAYELDPKYDLHARYVGLTYCYLGEAEKAQSYFESIIQQSSSDKDSRTSALFSLAYVEGFDEQQLRQYHEDLASLYASQTSVSPFKDSDKQPNEKLRVGYLSMDFFEHSVAHFMRAIIHGHDRDKVEVYCYSDVQYPDAVTEEFQAAADVWVESRPLSDKQLCERIRQDNIDVLVDLIGFFGNPRTAIFAHRAAPVQIAYLGYPNTSGVDYMDYRLSDEDSDPTGMTEAYYTETLYRLPRSFLCYTPIKDAPDISALPALNKNGTITFGSFNAFQKVSANLFESCTKILSRLPESELIIKSRIFEDDLTQEHILSRFENAGIQRNRIQLISWIDSKQEHLALYDKIDVHLDAFPYNGTTTTFEALWQGVPSLTLLGEVHRARVTGSIMKQLGLTQFVSNSWEEYVENAVQVASKLEQLSEIRAGMRARFQESGLIDHARFIEELETAYQEMTTSKSEQ